MSQAFKLRKQKAMENAIWRNQLMLRLRTQIGSAGAAVDDLLLEIKEIGPANPNLLEKIEKWQEKKLAKAKTAYSEILDAFTRRIIILWKKSLDIGMLPNEILDSMEALSIAMEDLRSSLERDDGFWFKHKIEELAEILFPKKKNLTEILDALQRHPNYLDAQILLLRTPENLLPEFSKAKQRIIGLSDTTYKIIIEFTTEMAIDGRRTVIPFKKDKLVLPVVRKTDLLAPYWGNLAQQEKYYLEAVLENLWVGTFENQKGKKYLTLHPEVLETLEKFGWTSQSTTSVGTIRWDPHFDYGTLFFLYLARASLERSKLEDNLAIWICLVFANIVLTGGLTNKLEEGNPFYHFAEDDMVLDFMLSSLSEAIGFVLGGIEWANYIPNGVSKRRNLLTGFCKIQKVAIEELARDLFTEKKDLL